MDDAMLYIGLLTLVSAIVGTVVAILNYIYTRKIDKRRISSEIARKEAILHQMDDCFTTRGVDHTVWDNLRVQKMLLQAEIEQLKKEV